MIAGSIILSRALQPVEQAIGGWKQVSNARAARRRLEEFFNRPRRRPSGLPLPAPKGHLTVDNLVFRLPGGEARSWPGSPSMPGRARRWR